MAKTLNEIKIEAATCPQTIEHAFITIHDLVDNLIACGETPSSEVAELKKKIESLTNTINWQAGILQATKDALYISSDKPMTAMPDEAAAIYLRSL